MEYFRFSLFNCITLLIMGLTPLMAIARWKGGLRTNWGLAYYAALLGYTLGFRGGINPIWAGTGVTLGVAIRISCWGRWLRWAEIAVFVYVLWRCLGLILLW